jgi:hypothetical protein
MHGRDEKYIPNVGWTTWREETVWKIIILGWILEKWDGNTCGFISLCPCEHSNKLSCSIS